MSLALICHGGTCRQGVVFDSTGIVAKRVASISNFIASCLGLHSVGQRLLRHGKRLRVRLLRLRSRLRVVQTSATLFINFTPSSAKRFPCDFIVTSIIGGDIACLSGCVAIGGNHGSKIRPSVKIISRQNIIKVISAISSRFSIMVPLLGPGFGLDYGILKDDCFKALD